MLYGIIYMWNLKYDTNKLTYETNRLTDIEKKPVVAKGVEEAWIRSLGLQTQAVIYRMDK